MKASIKSFSKKVFTKTKSESPMLKKGLFLLTSLGSVLVSFYFLVEGIFFHKPSAYVIVTVLYTSFCVYCFLRGRAITDEKKLENIFLLFLLVQNCISLPLQYFVSDGVNSGCPLLFMIGAVELFFFLDHITLLIAILLTNISYDIVYTIDWFRPDIVDSYTHLGNLTYFEIASSTLAIGIAIGLVLRIVLNKITDKHVESSRLLHQIEESSTKDPLTGAYNRRFLMNYIDECIAKTDSGEMRAFSLLMFDIDHFKDVNDTYGHLAGDDCIRGLTIILKNTLRDVDVVSRYGGEEFICVLPGAEETPAFRRAEQIREGVELTQLSEDIDRTVTVSGGVVMYTPGMTPQQLINEVDENLYIAKENGRNQIVWHKGGIPPLCYVAYDTTALRPIQNAGRRFSDSVSDIAIQKV